MWKCHIRRSLNSQVWTELKLLQDSNRYHSLGERLWYGGEHGGGSKIYTGYWRVAEDSGSGQGWHLVWWLYQRYLQQSLRYWWMLCEGNGNHRLNGSSSPVFNGDMSFLWEPLWLSAFFPNRPGGQTPNHAILTQNGLIDVDSRKNVPFAVKIGKNIPLTHSPPPKK